MLPDKMLEFKDVNCHGGKKNKEHLTAMVCTKMDGTEKMPLLIIGKSANPRCFKNVSSFPLEYLANKKAWMTGEIFTTWVKQLDKKMKRKIVLVIDNCPAHPQIPGLQSIELVFLPPNTTSKTQPMDQGIIQNLKIHNRKRVLLRYISAIDRKEAPHISVLDALHLLSQAWNSITETASDMQTLLPAAPRRQRKTTTLTSTTTSPSPDYESTASPPMSCSSSPTLITNYRHVLN